MILYSLNVGRRARWLLRVLFYPKIAIKSIQLKGWINDTEIQPGLHSPSCAPWRRAVCTWKKSILPNLYKGTIGAKEILLQPYKSEVILFTHFLTCYTTLLFYNNLMSINYVPWPISPILLFLFNFFLNFILFLAALGLHCCTQAFSCCGERGLFFVAVCRLLIAVASLVVEHGL